MPRPGFGLSATLGIVWLCSIRPSLADDDATPMVAVGRSIQKCDPERIAFRVPSDGWLADSCGTLFRSADRGETWRPLKEDEQPRTVLGATRSVIALVWFSENAGIIASAEGRIARTTDGGRTWSAPRLPTSCKISAAAQVGTNAWLCNSDGTLLRSTDNGGMWTALPPLPFRDECSVLTFGDADHGWVAQAAHIAGDPRAARYGYRAIEPLWRTTDGGRSWSRAAPFPRPLPTFAAMYESPTGAWVFGYRSNSVDDFATADGGLHWAGTGVAPNWWMFLVSRPQTWTSAMSYFTRARIEKPSDVSMVPAPTPVDAQAFIEDRTALLIKDHRLNVVVGSSIYKTFPILAPATGPSVAAPSQTVRGYGEHELWGFTEGHVLHSEDSGKLWFVTHDLPVAIDRLMFNGKRVEGWSELLLRGTDGRIFEIRDDSPDWRADDWGDLMTWNIRTTAVGEGATALSCIRKSSGGELQARIFEVGCFHGRSGHVKISWNKDGGELTGDLSEFSAGGPTTRPLSKLELQSIAGKLSGIAQRRDKQLCGSTTTRTAALVWQCDGRLPSATHFKADECGGQSQTALRAEALLDLFGDALKAAR